jgi:16S rRNA G966 N2-methylase RsmD
MNTGTAGTARGNEARSWSSSCTTGEDCTFQQLAPYIGRMKTSIARSLIGRFTRPGQVLFDPFAGSGVIPFEAAMLGRAVVACDTNPYGVLLMRAKFSAPASCAGALEQFDKRWARAQQRLGRQDLRSVPAWVRAFFHPETLRAALALRDELVAADDPFLMACLLGILHHQRPRSVQQPDRRLRTKVQPRAGIPRCRRAPPVLAVDSPRARRSSRSLIGWTEMERADSR